MKLLNLKIKLIKLIDNNDQVVVSLRFASCRSLPERLQFSRSAPITSVVSAELQYSTVEYSTVQYSTVLIKRLFIIQQI